MDLKKCCLTYCVYYYLLDKKSLVAFKCAIHFLDQPPKRGVKRPRMDANSRSKAFFQDFKVLLS